MLIDYRDEDNRRIVHVVEKRLDASSAVNFKTELKKQIDAGNKDIIIDLSEVDFIDSSGLGSLVSILKMVASEGTLSITGLQKKTEQIFKLTRMDTVFRLYPSVTEALEAA